MADKILGWGSLLAERWPLIFRSLMYFMLGSLPVLYIGFEKYGKNEVAPNPWLLIALLANAIYQGLVGLKAYFDGSAAQIVANIQARKNGGGGGFDTAHFTRQPSPNVDFPSVAATPGQSNKPTQ